MMTNVNRSYHWNNDTEGSAFVVQLFEDQVEKLCFVLDYIPANFELCRIFVMTRIAYWIGGADKEADFVDRFYADATSVIETRPRMFRVKGGQAYPIPAKNPIYLPE